MSSVLIAAAYLQHLLQLLCMHNTYSVSTHLLQLLCIYNYYCVPTAPVTATVYPQHLQCIYSTSYSYCVFTTTTVYLHLLLQLLFIHNYCCVPTAPLTATVYPQHLQCIYSTCYS